jgi:hypothetical protein
MTKVLEKRKKSLLEDIDYEEKIRVLNLNKRVEWFIENKKFMSQNEKWEAFYDIVEDYEVGSDVLLQRINNVIRKKGLSIWQK